MKIKYIASSSKEGDSILINTNDVSFSLLARVIAVMPAVIQRKSHNLMNDDAMIEFKYKGECYRLHSPFSDYIIESSEGSVYFREFANRLENFKVPWYGHAFPFLIKGVSKSPVDTVRH